MLIRRASDAFPKLQADISYSCWCLTAAVLSANAMSCTPDLQAGLMPSVNSKYLYCGASDNSITKTS